MAGKMDPEAEKQQHLDDHYGDLGLTLVDDDVEAGAGMTSSEARTFLRGLKPVAKVRQTLGSLVKKKS